MNRRLLVDSRRLVQKLITQDIELGGLIMISALFGEPIAMLSLPQVLPCLFGELMHSPPSRQWSNFTSERRLHQEVPSAS